MAQQDETHQQHHQKVHCRPDSASQQKEIQQVAAAPVLFSQQFSHLASSTAARRQCARGPAESLRAAVSEGVECRSH